MLYPKNQSPTLDEALFRNPTAEYRGAPFWAWNCELSRDLLLEEIEALKQMGFGGFHMHSRVGMATPYLSDEFMAHVRACVDKAKKEQMLAWLYDEDRWPSGYGGGAVTKKVENRRKSLVMTFVPHLDDSLSEADRAIAEAPEPELLYRPIACFDVALDERGTLIHYEKIAWNEAAKHRKLFAYMHYEKPCGWFNGQTYCDTLSRATAEDFLASTHERYKDAVGDEFGKTVPAIFSDEPAFTAKRYLSDPFDTRPVVMPYTDDFDETFARAYGFSVVDRLPELMFERQDGKPSEARYFFHDHAAERFASGFADPIGDWCKKNGIHFAGHLNDEPSLFTQTRSIGEAMRAYRGFTLPGIDMLADQRQLSTAKQCESAVHQYGREGMLSELYGVTEWKFDFPGHKLQGDWQAALGVTVRVPHLAWVSMRGEAKRDYPASIGYQSPWYREYGTVEDHFARVNTVMTRGRPIERTGVLHPIESYWVVCGPESQTGDLRSEFSVRYYEMIKWLLFSQLDFDLICESTLPAQLRGVDGGFSVGEMQYDAVVVPNLLTIRRTTLDALRAFRAAGGTVLFVGRIPTLVDARESTEPAEFAKECTCIDWVQSALLRALAPFRELSVSGGDNLIYQLRQDGALRHLFLCHVMDPQSHRTKDLPIESEIVPIEHHTVRLRGEWQVTLLDSLTGERAPLAASYANGQTELVWECAAYSSLLLELAPGRRTEGKTLTLRDDYTDIRPLADEAPFTLEEPNVLLLDQPSYSVDGGKWQPKEEILRIRRRLFSHYGLVKYASAWLNPPDRTIVGKVRFAYEFESEIDYTGALLGLESIEYAAVTLNGVPCSMEKIGYYVDKESIATIALPPVKRGMNRLEIELAVCNATQFEACYLLGNFGVRVIGRRAKLIPLPKTLAFSDITAQGLPFYGGNLTYHLEIEGGCAPTLQLQKIRGSAVRVDLDGEKRGLIAFPPHYLPLGELAPGKHRLDLTLLGNRANTFGTVHNTDEHIPYCDASCWETKGRLFTYGYMLREAGILTIPYLVL